MDINSDNHLKKLQKKMTIREVSKITGCSTATVIKVKKVMINRHMLLF